MSDKRKVSSKNKASGKNKTGKISGSRNIHANHPIMRKGGVHEKSQGAKRAADKRDTRKLVKERPHERISRSDFKLYAIK